MMPLGLFRSKTFAGANLLTLLLYSALSGMLFFLPFNLIRVQGYGPTLAGTALVPFVLVMFLLSRWASGLVDRFGSKVPAYRRAGYHGLRVRSFCLAERGRRELLDHIFPGDHGDEHRDDDQRRAADDHGDGRGGRASCRNGLGDKQRRFPHRGAAGGGGFRVGDAEGYSRALDGQ